MKKLLSTLLLLPVLLGVARAQFTADLAGYPLITTGWNIGGYGAVVDSSVKLTDPRTTQNGYVYYDSVVNLTACAQFNVKFDFKIEQYLTTTIADGIAFWYIANPPSGFITGGGIGLPSFPQGLILILDTYDNNGDGNNPSETLLFYPGTVAGYVEGSPTGVLAPVVPRQTFITDGAWHHVELDYNAGNIRVFFNYSPIPSITGFYAITTPGYFGFSSSTGAAYSTQSVKNIHITATGISAPPRVVSPVTYCQFDAADTLYATGTGGAIHWFTTDTATVSWLPGSPRPATTVPGTYTYYVRQGVGPCISSPDSIKVIVNPQPPRPVISGRTFYCQDTAFVPFTVAATGTVLWYTTGTGGTGTTTPPVVNTTLPGVYTYWASQTVLGCESLRDSITVTVHASPAPPVITGTDTYCQFFPYVAPTATGTNILWYTAPTGGVGTIAPPTINTNIPGTYTIYATQNDLLCISPRGPFTITVNPKPTPPVISAVPSNYCPGQPFVPFTVVSGTGILWYTAATGGTGSSVAPGVNTTVPGTYTVWASQTVLGCESDRVPVTVTVADNIKADFSYAIKYGCKADTVVFTNNSIATSFAWDFGDGYASILKDPTHVYVLQAIDTVKLTVSTAACTDTQVQYINLVHPLRAAFSVDTNLICQGQAITVTDSSTGTGSSIVWNFDDGGRSTARVQMHQYPHAGTYKVMQIVTDFIPCSDTAYRLIQVDTISGLRIGLTDTVLCRGTYATLTGYYAALGNTGITWNMGNGDSVKNNNPLSYAYESIGTYTITARADYRICPNPSAARTITVLPAPVINIGSDTSICKGSEPLILSDKVNTGNKLARWVWSTGATTSAITVTTPGIYQATVRINGCNASASVKVDADCYMNIPNAFTPNGDGINDYFYPRQALSSGLTSFRMQIFNRWGQLIFDANSLEGRGWDGRLNDVDQPEGVYVYIIEGTFHDGQKERHQGNVTLIR